MGRRHHKRRLIAQPSPLPGGDKPLRGPREPWQDAAAMWLNGNPGWKKAAQRIDPSALIEIRRDERT